MVTEPTDLNVAIAHKGFEWVEIETEGRAAHGSRPREGRDAIRLMGRVLTALDQLDRTLQARTSHPLLGTASLHASLIEGGRELSSYPDRCHLQMERRTITGDHDRCALHEVEAILEQLRRDDPQFTDAERAEHLHRRARDARMTDVADDRDRQSFDASFALEILCAAADAAYLRFDGVTLPSAAKAHVAATPTSPSRRPTRKRSMRCRQTRKSGLGAHAGFLKAHLSDCGSTFPHTRETTFTS